MTNEEQHPDPRELTLEEILARPCPKPTFPEQNADGVDLSLIREMLKLSPEDRVLLIERHADEVREMNRVAQRRDKRPIR
ncbi:MAG: hypothetical protein ACE37H_13075 [Phycisphaeraceae bacterium]